VADTQRTTIVIAKRDESRASGEHGRLGIQAEDNRWFGSFDTKLWPRLVVGANLNVEYTTSADGKYKNITGVLGTAASNGTGEPSSKDVEIRRAVALKAAVDYMGNLAGGLTGEPDEINRTLDLADRFVVWLSDREVSDSPF
jgi:hypothetical protein